MILAITVGILLAASPAIAAADFPTRPLQIVVPFTAGGNTDTIARLLAEHMQDSLKQPVTVVNRPGAGTNIGAAYVANGNPDGYTMLLEDQRDARASCGPWHRDRIAFAGLDRYLAM